MNRNIENLTEHERKVYEDFIGWLKNSWYGVPSSDILLPYVVARYTLDEAKLLTGMPFSLKAIDELAKLKGMVKEDLSFKLDELAKKGLVYRSRKDGILHYNLNDIFFVYRTFGWPGRTDDHSKQVAPLQVKYFNNGLLDPFEHVKEKGLRVLPIEFTIKDNRQVLPYEEVAKILESAEYFSVSHCPCRHPVNLTPGTPNCKYPTEVCLHFDRLGRYIVENGLGREITRLEAEEILKNCAELGLVHGISNQQDKPDTICNCCRCCCIWFTAFHKLKHSGSLTPSNFKVHINDATCLGCGLCVKRCPMEAIQLIDMPSAKGRKTIVKDQKKGDRELTNKTEKVASINADLCIGCGVCAYKCQSHSLVMKRLTTEHHPPKTGRDWMMQFMSDQQAAPRR